jgi:hypothetical protein
MHFMNKEITKKERKRKGKKIRYEGKVVPVFF